MAETALVSVSEATVKALLCRLPIISQREEVKLHLRDISSLVIIQKKEGKKCRKFIDKCFSRVISEESKNPCYLWKTKKSFWVRR